MRTCRVNSRIIATFALLLVHSTPCRSNDTFIIPDPQPESVQSEPVDDVSPVVDPAETDVTQLAPADSGMWFVSTHNSPQSFDHSCPAFCPSVSRYDDCVGYRNSDFEEMCASLEPGVPVCIVIHGSFVDRPSACREAVCTLNWIRSASMGQRMQMIYFSWPSYRPMNTPLVAIEVNRLGRRAARNGYYLAEMLQHFPPECPVCLIGHSHGTRVAASALHLLAGGAIQGICHPFARTNGRAIRTVFFASAIDHDWFNPRRRYDRALCSTQCLLNMKNSRDAALKLYPLRLPLISHRSLGTAGFTRWDRNRLGPYSRRVFECDVSRTVGTGHFWPFYFTKPALAMMMRNYVYFPDLQVPQQAAATVDRTHR